MWLCLAGALLFSCATQKKVAPKPALSQPRQYFEAGEFQKAIDSYSTALKKHPREKAVLNEYVRTLEETKRLADAAMEKKDFASAEKVLVLLEQNYPQFKPVEKSLSFTLQDLSQKIIACRISLREKQALMSLQAGDFQKTLDIYKAASKDYPGDPRLSAGLKKATEEIRRVADRALAKEDYISAGKAYFVLRKDYPLYEKLSPSPLFSKGTLDEGIKNCRTRLTQKGLEQYRKGKLTEAISLWQGILLFDPDNIEIKKAIQTANAQLKKLQKK